MNLQPQPIKIAIVDDHLLFRKGVSALMGEFKEIHILFEAEHGLQLQQRLTGGVLPEVILMDISMPGMDGYTATTWLKAHYPAIKVLALSMFEDEKAIIRMIKSGAGGYVLKETKPVELLEAIKTIHTRGVFINDLVSGKLIRSVAAGDGDPVFSKNELKFMQLCCSELSYKEIAALMFVSPRTVDNYREALFEKLTIKTRTGLVLYAIKNGLFSFDDEPIP